MSPPVASGSGALPRRCFQAMPGARKTHRRSAARSASRSGGATTSTSAIGPSPRAGRTPLARPPCPIVPGTARAGRGAISCAANRPRVASRASASTAPLLYDCTGDQRGDQIAMARSHQCKLGAARPARSAPHRPPSLSNPHAEQRQSRRHGPSRRVAARRSGAPRAAAGTPRRDSAVQSGGTTVQNRGHHAAPARRHRRGGGRRNRALERRPSAASCACACARTASPSATARYLVVSAHPSLHCRCSAQIARLADSPALIRVQAICATRQRRLFFVPPCSVDPAASCCCVVLAACGRPLTEAEGRLHGTCRVRGLRIPRRCHSLVRNPAVAGLSSSRRYPARPARPLPRARSGPPPATASSRGGPGAWCFQPRCIVRGGTCWARLHAYG